MNKLAFKQRMQSLKSYRESNPGKGYWDWRVEQFIGGGEVTEPYTRPTVNAALIKEQAGKKSIDEVMSLQNEKQKEFAKWWYTERAKQAKYQSQLGNGQLEQVLSNIDQSTYTPFDNLYLQEYNRQHPNAQLDEFAKNSILQEGRKQYQGFALENGKWTSRLPAAGKFAVTSWHEGIGHIVGDRMQSILDAADEYRATSIPKGVIDESKASEYNNYRNQANEKHAETWGFRGANINLKDDQGNYYIDPNRQLTGDDIQEMINKGAVIPSQFEGLTPEQIATRHNGFAYTDTPQTLIPMAKYGDEVPTDPPTIVNGQRVNPWTGQPIATGQITPILDLRTAADFTPVGDALAVSDAIQSVANKDWLGATLAGLSILPFVPKVKTNYVQDAIERNLQQRAKTNDILNQFYDQRNNVYEDLIENEDAFRRAANVDRKYGTSYLKQYQDMIRGYYNDPSAYNDDLTKAKFDPLLYGTDIKGQVDPSLPGWISLNDRYRDLDEVDEHFKNLNPGLVRHEMGHQTDLKAGLDYTNTLADPDKFVSDDRLKEMFPKSHNYLRNSILNRGSEIKSYINEFRDYLMNKGQYEPKETIKGFQRKLDQHSKEFKTLRMIFDSYKKKSDFIKDYNNVPLVSTNNDKNLV